MGASPERTMTWSYLDNASRATISAWPVPRCSACTTKLTRACCIAVRTRSASWPMIANTSLAGTTLAAARITCSRTGLPPTSCSTLGICDFSRVPLPAAIIATAMRGTKGAPDFDDRFDNRFRCRSFQFEFRFQFLHSNFNISRLPSDGHFQQASLQSCGVVANYARAAHAMEETCRST